MHKHIIKMAYVNNFKKFISLEPIKKKILLDALGYSIDNRGFVVDEKSKKRVWCKYSKRAVHFNEAAVLPGSTIVIKSTPISLSSYIEEYLE